MFSVGLVPSWAAAVPPGRLSLQRIRARELKEEQEYRELPVPTLRVCRNISSSPPPHFMPLFIFLSFRKRRAGEQCYTCQNQNKRKFQHKVGVFPEYFRQNLLFKWKTRRKWQFPPNSRSWYEFTAPEIRSRVQGAHLGCDLHWAVEAGRVRAKDIQNSFLLLFIVLQKSVL